MMAKAASKPEGARKNNGQAFPLPLLGEKVGSSSEKVRKVRKRVKKHPKNTTVTRCRSLGYRCKVDSRASHNPRVPEITFSNCLAGIEAARKRKSCNFGRLWRS